MPVFKNKKLPLLLLILTVIVVGGVFFPAHSAQACVPLPTNDCTFDDMLKDGAAWMANTMLSICGLALWAAGVFLNNVVNYTVIKMADTVSNIGTLTMAWGVIRDIANIGFIFALLFIGIATILRLENYGARRLLAGLIIGALLINFSLFFTKVVIDSSNILAYQFYQKMALPNCSQTFCDGGLSDKFMGALKLTTVYKAGGNTNTAALSSTGKPVSTESILVVGIFGSIFILISAFVFFAAAILLAIRFVVLIFLMILAPIGIAGLILPVTAKYAKKWWSTLFAQAFFAPAYLLLTYISLLLIGGIPTKNVDYATAFIGGDGSTLFSTILNFIIVIAFMVFSLKVAKDIGAYGSNLAIRVAAGAPAGFLRNTAGRGFSKLANLEAMRRWTGGKDEEGQKLPWWKTKVGDIVTKTGQFGGHSSFDVRSIKPVGEAAKGFGLDLGKGSGKGGYDQKLKSQVEREFKFAEKLGGPSDRDPAIVALNQQIKSLGTSIEGMQEKVVAANNKLAATIRTNRGDKSPETQLEIEGAKAEVAAAQGSLGKEQRVLKQIQDQLNAEKSRYKTGYAQRLGSERKKETLYIKVPRKNKESSRLILKGSGSQTLLEGLTERLREDSSFRESIKPEEA